MRGLGFKGIRFGNRVSGSTPPPAVIDPDAQALFDTVGDIPEWFKPATNSLIVDFKAQGVWDNPNFYCILCIPSISDSQNSLIEIKSLTVRANFDINGGVNNLQSIYRTFSTNDGYLLDTSWIDTNLQPSTEMSANDNCDWMVLYEDEISPAGSDYNYGAFDNPNLLGVTAIDNTGEARGFTYRTSQKYSGSTNAGQAGVYLNNRVSPTYAEMVVNGSVAGTIATASGAPTTRTVWLNALNRAGLFFRNQSRFCAWGSFGEGLNSTRRDAINTALTSWQVSLKRRKADKTKSVIWDGNSFNTFWYSALQRGTQFSMSSYREWHFDTEAVSGKELRTMDANYATDIDPKYNGSYTKNIYILNETVNDYTMNGDLTASKGYFDSIISKAKATGFDILVFGGPVRKWQPIFAVPDQETLNLGLDDYQQYIRDQAPIQGYTFVEPPSNIWVYRADYASDALYDTACNDIYTDSAVMEVQFSHPTEDVCINDWSPLIVNAINTI